MDTFTAIGTVPEFRGHEFGLPVDNSVELLNWKRSKRIKTKFTPINGKPSIKIRDPLVADCHPRQKIHHTIEVRDRKDGRGIQGVRVAPALNPNGVRFKKALQFAMRVHSGDLRKGTSIPYVSHLFGVCALVLEDGGDEDEAIAAVLHDTLEDHREKVTPANLQRQFGSRAAEIVVLCTDTPPEYRGGPKPPWCERKKAYVERIRGEVYPRCRVALADKLHNTRAIVKDYRHIGDKVWSRFNAGKEDQIKFHKAMVKAFRKAQAPKHLVQELDSLVKELEKGGASK